MTRARAPSGRPSKRTTTRRRTRAARPPAAGSCAIVLFGATGDLVRRKLVPALYHLELEGLLGRGTTILCIGRDERTDAELRAELARRSKPLTPGRVDARVWRALERRLRYVVGDFTDAALFERLRDRLDGLERAGRTDGDVLFYLATAPDHFAPIAAALAKAGLTTESGGRSRRVVVEKPFGRDLASARRLDASLLTSLSERQIYRIDHYLGKETVQNLLVLRFANAIFEPVWDRAHVDHVQITVAETIGVEGRGATYERAGALRDMVPNHVFQLISLVAMEPPASFDADAVRDEQTKVLRAIPPFTARTAAEGTVRGQYAAGRAGGRVLRGYRREPDVDPRSDVETFVAMRLTVESARWTGVPFYVRVGKAMEERATQIVVQWKPPPLPLFRRAGAGAPQPNRLVIRIQPEESISLEFTAKIPGETVRVGDVDMDFRYVDHFGEHPSTGYERLLYDALVGDQTLFQRAETVEAAWRVVDPVLAAWRRAGSRGLVRYRAGTCGPRAAERLLAKDGRSWRPTTVA